MYSFVVFFRFIMISSVFILLNIGVSQYKYLYSFKLNKLNQTNQTNIVLSNKQNNSYDRLDFFVMHQLIHRI